MSAPSKVVMPDPCRRARGTGGPEQRDRCGRIGPEVNVGRRPSSRSLLRDRSLRDEAPEVEDRESDRRPSKMSFKVVRDHQTRRAPRSGEPPREGRAPSASARRRAPPSGSSMITRREFPEHSLGDRHRPDAAHPEQRCHGLTHRTALSSPPASPGSQPGGPPSMLSLVEQGGKRVRSRPEEHVSARCRGLSASARSWYTVLDAQRGRLRAGVRMRWRSSLPQDLAGRRARGCRTRLRIRTGLPGPRCHRTSRSDLRGRHLEVHAPASAAHGPEALLQAPQLEEAARDPAGAGVRGHLRRGSLDPGCRAGASRRSRCTDRRRRRTCP